MTFKTSLLAGTMLGAAFIAAPAMAQSAGSASQAQLDALAQQIQALQGQLTSLKDSVAKDKVATEKKLADLPKVTADGGRMRVQTADKKFDVALRARIHMDYGTWVHKDNFTTDATDGFQLRRAFLGVAGTVYNDWGFEFTGNFANDRGGASQIQAANITYNGIKNSQVILGVFQPKFTLDDSTSSNDIAFMERAPIGNIVVGIGGSDSRTGVGISTKGDNYFLAGYVTGNQTGTTGTIDDMVNLLGRAAYQFYSSNEGGAGIGVSGVYQVTPQAAARTSATQITTTASFGDRPGLRIGGNRTSLTSTGTINQIEGQWAYGADLGANFKNFWVAGEYYVFGADTEERLPGTTTRNSFQDPEFDGYYVSAGYILTGERRSYKPGEWTGVKPAWPVGQNGFGAWELAARYSTVNLIDRAGGVAGSGTGEEKNWTIGVNWYVNNAIRFMLNYVNTTVDRPNGTDQGLDAVALRMQFQF
ncbi:MULTISPECIES: OprO/OprP family phosphate-selective porin [unclassified Azospirillum]|uniref:OprO/OprP family phosphate-selective porin n=1 Tax=unclassified Azospirillum TaxID=2630922 RepID=UPI000B691761|nr:MULTISPECIES: porin [unclassified Azospirillum]SNS18294.1 phosphate-selective porin OprO and OprP [Azospirillum sp. RU38E]SNS35832.1 phosphate-selective porin OprO and OprP [Azospirillum sp. RU37A]